MKKSDKKKIEEFIRVDHAGERGAIKIYEGQLLALNTFIKDEDLKKTIEEMKEHEHEHASYFEKEIRKNSFKPTKFLPLWDLLGVGVGFGSTLLGKKVAMLCTASVEEVIDEHYQNQINQIDLNFSYNFDQNIAELKDIKIDNKINQNVNKILNNIILKKDDLQNKIYFKNLLNKAIKSYAG